MLTDLPGEIIAEIMVCRAEPIEAFSHILQLSMNRLGGRVGIFTAIHICRTNMRHI